MTASPFVSAAEQGHQGTISIDIGRAAHTVTKALDYVGVDDNSHGRRVGLICHRVAHYLGWSRQRRHFVLLAGMLHDCGVSSTETHRKLVEELEWSGAQEHCQRGAGFLESFPPFRRYARSIHYHHTRWNQMPDSLDQATREYSNLIFLADRTDVAFAQFRQENPDYRILLDREAVLGRLRPHVGHLFAPELFQGLEQAAEKDSFWLELSDDYLDSTLFETLSSIDYSLQLSFDEIEALGELISQIVDAKSPFTHFHSLRVADLTDAVSVLLGYDDYTRRILRLAGLLHDVGKLRTPDLILEKPGVLSPDEQAQMRSHPLDSKHVLQLLFPHTPIARWAAEHHEKLDGSGYPFGWTGERIDGPTRVLTLCDIFQALCQKRPYRERLPVDQVLEIMQGMVSRGQLDADIFRLMCAHRHDLYRIAVYEGDAA